MLTAPPSQVAGVEHPHPLITSRPAEGHASPAPQTSNVGHANVRPRPIAVAPTPTPVPTQRPRPVPKPTRNPYAGLNARLNALLPSGPVTVHQGHYVGSLDLSGRLEPTPPPEALARTRYIFEGPAGGGHGRIKMWVASVQRKGPIVICTGWMVRFPETVSQGILAGAGAPNLGANGIQIGGQHTVQTGLASGMDPIILGNGSMECSERALTPFTPPASSP